MFRDRNADRARNGAPLLTIKGENARLEGTFTITDSIEIECEVAGAINIEGKLVIGANGVVRADVHTADALIMGRYEGNMVATGNVEITSSGRVSGNIETDSLVISKGGVFNGNVIKMQRGEHSQERHPSPSLVDSKQIGKRQGS